MEDNKNAKLLKFIHDNAGMGVHTLEQLNGILQSGDLRKLVESQLLEYKGIFDQSKRKLQAIGEEIKDINFAAKAGSSVMINIKTLMDKSSQNVASMVLLGSMRGIIEITKNLKDFKDCCDDAVNLAYRLLWLEQKNVDEMKHFL